MASPAFRAEAHVVNASAASTLVVSKPTGTASGDALILVVNVDDAAGTFTWPSGFTAGQSGSSSFDGGTAAWAWKVAGGSEPSTYTTTITSGSVRGAAVMLAYSGADGTTPINAQAAVATSSSGNAMPATVTANAVTTTVTDTTLVWVGANDDTGLATGYTPPSGFTERYDTGNTQGATFSVADKAQAAMGSSGPTAGTATGTGTTGWIAFQIALAPAGGGGGGGGASDQALLLLL